MYQPITRYKIHIFLIFCISICSCNFSIYSLKNFRNNRNDLIQSLTPCLTCNPQTIFITFLILSDKERYSFTNAFIIILQFLLNFSFPINKMEFVLLKMTKHNIFFLIFIYNYKSYFLIQFNSIVFFLYSKRCLFIPSEFQNTEHFFH